MFRVSSFSDIRSIRPVEQTNFARSICRPSQFRCCSFSRDAFGTPDELRPIIEELNAPADLYIVDDGDHSFKVFKRAVITQEDTYRAMLDRIASWLRQTFPN
jgi:hypothetical protein